MLSQGGEGCLILRFLSCDFLFYFENKLCLNFASLASLRVIFCLYIS